MKAGPCLKEVTVSMEELKNSQNLFLDEIKNRGESLKKQKEKFKKACGHDIKTSIWYDGGPMQGCPEKQQQMLFSPGNKHNSNISCISRCFQDENMLN